MNAHTALGQRGWDVSHEEEHPGIELSQTQVCGAAVLFTFLCHSYLHFIFRKSDFLLCPPSHTFLAGIGINNRGLTYLYFVNVWGKKQ